MLNVLGICRLQNILITFSDNRSGKLFGFLHFLRTVSYLDGVPFHLHLSFASAFPIPSCIRSLCHGVFHTYGRILHESICNGLVTLALPFAASASVSEVIRGRWTEMEEYNIQYWGIVMDSRQETGWLGHVELFCQTLRWLMFILDMTFTSEMNLSLVWIQKFNLTLQKMHTHKQLFSVYAPGPVFAYWIIANRVKNAYWL